METFLKIFAVIGPIIVPLLIAFWNSRYSVRKHPKEEFAEDVRIAENFSSIFTSNQSNLVKDRLSQQLLETKKITYLEAIYFYQFSDMEKWINQYIELRGQLKLVRNSKGEVLKIHHPYSRIKVYSFALGYVVFAFASLLPFLFINWFIEVYISSMESKQYLVIFNLVIWPIISLIVAISFLLMGVKYNDAKRFVKNFETTAIKV